MKGIQDRGCWSKKSCYLKLLSYENRIYKLYFRSFSAKYIIKKNLKNPIFGHILSPFWTGLDKWEFSKKLEFQQIFHSWSKLEKVNETILRKFIGNANTEMLRDGQCLIHSTLLSQTSFAQFQLNPF